MDYDGRAADISVAPRMKAFRGYRGLFDTFVALTFYINAIVGIKKRIRRGFSAESAKTGLKSRRPGARRRGMRVALTAARGCHMSPNIDLLKRVRSEFIEMPGLRLRIDQAQRLWNLDRALCESVLRALVDAKFLGRFENDLYARL